MGNLIKLAITFFVFGFLTSCQNNTEMAGFDNQVWKKDAGSCQGKRPTLVSDFDKVKDQFFGMSEKEVKQLLGRPDGEELFDRNQRLFYYYIEPGTHCNTRGRLSEANRVQIRFSSLSKVNEITYAQPVSL